jgi:hypothetical protein
MIYFIKLLKYSIHIYAYIAVVTLIRKNGGLGVASVKIETYDISATDAVDYEGFKGFKISIKEYIYH